MMVLRRPPSSTVVHPPDARSEDEERSTAIPMDLSKSSVRSIEVSPHHHRHLKLSNNNNNNTNNNNNNNNSIFNNNAKSILFGATFPTTNTTPTKPALDFSSRLGRLPRISPGTESRWRSEEDTSYSSPDSGLQRDSPGEDEEALNSASANPVSLKRNSLIPLSLIRERYIHVNPRDNEDEPYSPPSAPRDEEDEDDEDEDRRRTAAILRRIQETQEEHDPNDEDEDNSSSNMPSFHSPPPRDYKVQTKRARLEEMVSAIKKTGPKSDRSRRHSGGDDDTSSGGQGTSGDEVTDPDAPADLRRLRPDPHLNASLLAKGLKGYMMAATGGSAPSFAPPGSVSASNNHKKPQQVLSPSNFINNNNRTHLHKNQDHLLDETSANLLSGGKTKSLPDLPFPGMDPSAAAAALGGLLPKNFQPLSPSDASKIYGVDPETYQQQMMQLQLTSAAMLGDPGGLLKAMGSYPPWVYLGYYSQLLHSFQAQEILRQYAIQSQSPTVGPGETSPPAPRILSSSAYNNCGSPPSPASVSESPAGIDSDGSVVGQGTLGGSSGGGNGSNAGGKRAPRAMTGRHVRTGTGASPTTLQTLRLKIEERQRIKAQQLRHDMMLQSHGGHNNSSKGKSKYSKKFKK